MAFCVKAASLVGHYWCQSPWSEGLFLHTHWAQDKLLYASPPRTDAAVLYAGFSSYVSPQAHEASSSSVCPPTPLRS